MQATGIFALTLAMLATFVAGTRPAYADYMVKLVPVQCDGAHNRVLVRFGAVDNDGYPPIGSTIGFPLVNAPTSPPYGEFAEVPESLTKDWAQPQNAGSCHLKNGKIVSLREEDGGISNGQGGEDPSAFFTMTISGHVIYDHYAFYKGYSLSTFTLGAIVYEDGKLTECVTNETSDTFRSHVISHPQCTDASRRLLPGHAFLTPDEQTAYALDQKRALLQAALSAFCRHLQIPDNVKDFTFSDDSSVADINNDGRPDRVFFVKSGGLPLYNQLPYLVAFTSLKSNPNAFASAFKKINFPDTNAVATAAKADGGIVINLALGNEIFTDNSVTYIYSANPSKEAVPSAIISKMLPNNSVRQLCAFP